MICLLKQNQMCGGRHPINELIFDEHLNMPRVLHILYHLILTTTQCSRSYYPVFPMKILRLKSKFTYITASKQEGIYTQALLSSKAYVLSVL